MNIQMPFIKIHKVKSSKYDWPICKCVDRDLLELDFIANITLIKVLFWNEYSNAIYQNPQNEIFKV